MRFLQPLLEPHIYCTAYWVNAVVVSGSILLSYVGVPNGRSEINMVDLFNGLSRGMNPKAKA